MQDPLEDASDEGCAIQIAQVFGNGDEAVDKQVCVTQHVLILSLQQAEFAIHCWAVMFGPESGLSACQISHLISEWPSLKDIGI